MSKERSINLKGHEVRAVISGAKTQIRRLIDPQPVLADPSGDMRWAWPDKDPWKVSWWGTESALMTDRCPFGTPGNKLWVREGFAYSVKDHDTEFVGYTEDTHDVVYQEGHHGGEWTHYEDDGKGDFTRTKIAPPWKPSVHMPRWASRILLEITDTRVRRLQDISEEDAQAEGVRPFFEVYDRIGRDQRITSGERAEDYPYRASFACQWDEQNSNRALWSANPWVWVISFKRI